MCKLVYLNYQDYPSIIYICGIYLQVYIILIVSYRFECDSSRAIYVLYFVKKIDQRAGGRAVGTLRQYNEYLDLKETREHHDKNIFQLNFHRQQRLMSIMIWCLRRRRISKVESLYIYTQSDEFRNRAMEKLSRKVILAQIYTIQKGERKKEISARPHAVRDTNHHHFNQ